MYENEKLLTDNKDNTFKMKKIIQVYNNHINFQTLSY